MTVPVKLAERPGAPTKTDPASGGLRRRSHASRSGADRRSARPRVREMDRRFVAKLEVPSDVQGVVVTRVDPTGRGASGRSGAARHPRDQPPSDPLDALDYQRSSERLAPGDVLAIYYYDPTIAQRGAVTVTRRLIPTACLHAFC